MSPLLSHHSLTFLQSVTDRCDRYKPSLPLRFLTEELGFESDRQCLDFIVNDSLNGDESLIENRGSDERPEVYVLVQKGAPVFERGKTLAFGRVDIKGQI